MTIEIKNTALNAAIWFTAHNGGGTNTPAQVVEAAAAFEAFLIASGPTTGTPPAADVKKTATPPVKLGKTVPAANDADTPPAALDYEKDVKAPMMALAQAKGRDAVTPIFTQFKVKNALGLKPEQWPAFIAAVAKAAA